MISFLNFKREVFGKSKTSEREELAEKNINTLAPSASADVFYSTDLKTTKTSFGYQDEAAGVTASQAALAQGPLRQTNTHKDPVVKRTNSAAENSFEKTKSKFQGEKGQHKGLKGNNTALKKGLVQYAFKDGAPLSGRITGGVNEQISTKRLSYANQ